MWVVCIWISYKLVESLSISENYHREQHLISTVIRMFHYWHFSALSSCVALTGPLHSQILRYNFSTCKWRHQTMISKICSSSEIQWFCYEVDRYRLIKSSWKKAYLAEERSRGLAFVSERGKEESSQVPKSPPGRGEGPQENGGHYLKNLAIYKLRLLLKSYSLSYTVNDIF